MLTVLLDGPAFLQGNLRAKKFDIVHVVRGSRRVVAHVSKESRFANTTAFLM
jgi:hypothetical protein